MIWRSVTVRHSRRTLTSPTTLRPALRQLSTTPPVDPKSLEGEWQTLQKESEKIKAKSTPRKKQDVLNGLINSLATSAGHEHRGPAWTRAHALENGEQLDVTQQWKEFQRIQAHTRKLGSKVDRRYVTSELVVNPPRPEDISLEMLMASQTHMGHHKSLWNPANARYIYGVREDCHIISLEVTAAHLRRAARVVEEVAHMGGLILFVGTRKGQMEIVTKASELAGACHIFTKWTPGAITNRDVILKNHETKVVNHKDAHQAEFDLYTHSARPLMPDLVVCLNPMENYTLLYECGLKNIPTIGVIDTNADPTWVTYTIPANDDSLRSIGVIGGVLGRAGERGQQRRKEKAAREMATWTTSPQLRTHMQRESADALSRRAKMLKEIPQTVTDFTEEEQKMMATIYETPEVDSSEEAMLSAMGGAVADAAEDMVAQAEKTSTVDIVGAIDAQLDNVRKTALETGQGLAGASTAELEAQLAAIKTKALGIEQELTRNSGSDIEAQLASIQAKALDIEQELTRNSSSDIEAQLANIQAAAAEIEKGLAGAAFRTSEAQPASTDASSHVEAQVEAQAASVEAIAKEAEQGVSNGSIGDSISDIEAQLVNIKNTTADIELRLAKDPAEHIETQLSKVRAMAVEIEQGLTGDSVSDIEARLAKIRASTLAMQWGLKKQQ